ncbi:MAG: DNA polymerase I [Gammaproteobacteria bacterium]
MNDNTLLLVDGSSYLFRAYHALPPLSTSSGQPTGAIHGVIAMLRRLLNAYQPAYVAVVFDAKGKTFRDALYPEYKATRPPMPEELSRQIAPLHSIIRALGLPLLIIEGVEADDVIGTLATKASREQLQSVISTGDKDLAQLVNERVCLVNTMDDTLLDHAAVQNKFGVTPEQIVDYLTLIGDTVDNIPGVPMVGPKTAAKWIKQYGTLDAIVENAHEIKGKVGGNLRASLAYLPLSRKLLTIDRDLHLDCGPRDLKTQPPDKDTLRCLYKELEFKALLKDLITDEEAQPQTLRGLQRYETIVEKAGFERWMRKLKEAPLFCLDTETTSLDYIVAELVGISFATQPGEAAYIPLAHDYPGAPTQLDRHAVLMALKPLLEDPERSKVGHNLKYDMSVLANYGIELGGVRHDSMLESYVLDSTASRHDMDSLALKYLGRRTIHFEDVAGQGAKQIPFNRVAVDRASAYAAEDADVSLQLHCALWPRLDSAPRLKSLYREIEIPLVPVLSRMERNGVLVDEAMLRMQSGDLAERIRIIEQEAQALAGVEFNLGSPKQIQFILFEKLGLPAKTKTPKGQASTAESVLQQLALDYPLPKLMLEHRALSKLKSTYTDKLPRQINKRTGRVHTSYHQAVAATGRLSSSDPNLQNIPVRTEEGRRIRQAFIAGPGCQLLAADYSQIELRIMAHLSGDQGLCEAFAKGEDIHRATAAEVFGLALEEVGAEQRRAAKAINFGLIYGMSAFGLARQLGLERSCAQEYIDRYFSRYPRVKRFMQETRERARRQGYVETVFGRRLYLPEIHSRNSQRRQYAERTAINAPMQGSSADIIKRAMVWIDQWLRESHLKAKMIMQVHDELVFEVADPAVDTAREHIRRLMVEAAQLSVPLLVEVGLGPNWDEAH